MSGFDTQVQAQKILGLTVLISAMDFYFEDRRVTLLLTIAAEIFLLNEMLVQRIGSTELGWRLGMIPQEANRIVDFHRKTKIDTMANVQGALGKMLKIAVV